MILKINGVFSIYKKKHLFDLKRFVGFLDFRRLHGVRLAVLVKEILRIGTNLANGTFYKQNHKWTQINTIFLL
ncbi:hypothetical protein C7Y71_008915 [Pseudoprevotella muciniphila]|uniref:Uncharacterized protein n=1 Tax=Pseudoprevotella muciniphila TaxID=2133944 RepID=A0A5P8E804_9BACT|nr:hypothetical protein C7Y71_008915 [Pseudoprevotella muciniphila]